jgi:hypothetical protein
VTRKRVYRCRDCNWRGWGVDLGTWRADNGGLLPEPLNLGVIGLARHDRRKDLDLDALDAIEPHVDESDEGT